MLYYNYYAWRKQYLKCLFTVKYTKQLSANIIYIYGFIIYYSEEHMKSAEVFENKRLLKNTMFLPVDAYLQ